ncbi:MAG TPA: PEP-CTERM sorting domain-containing protein [Myxococcota bacterium]
MDRSLRSCTRGAALLLALALLPATAQALPVISEFFYDAVGSDDGLSFIELYGAPGTSLAGLALEGVNGSNGAVGPSLALSGAIPADGIFVVADATAGGPTSVPGADLLLDFDFQNGPDSVVLRSGGVVLDALGYGVFAPGEVFAGEGAPAADPAAGASLARRFADVDTGDNAADFVVLETPTPGSAQLAAVPEPASASLLGAGLAGLAAGCGRRRRPRG